MKGLNTLRIKIEEQDAQRGALGGLSYGNKISKKEQKIHIVLRNPLNTNAVLPVCRRCECGGHTFSAIWDGAKFVCHHCGKQYFAKEFESLPEEGLMRHEVEDRRIYAMLLAGGDLREHAEKSVLVLKNYAGIPEGELPIAYASHLAEVYKNATVVTLFHKIEEPATRRGITVVRRVHA